MDEITRINKTALECIGFLTKSPVIVRLLPELRVALNHPMQWYNQKDTQEIDSSFFRIYLTLIIQEEKYIAAGKVLLA